MRLDALDGNDKSADMIGLARIGRRDKIASEIFG
jgi:hypothetical protein